MGPIKSRICAKLAIRRRTNRIGGQSGGAVFGTHVFQVSVTSLVVDCAGPVQSLKTHRHTRPSTTFQRVFPKPNSESNARLAATAQFSRRREWGARDATQRQHSTHGGGSLSRSRRFLTPYLCRGIAISGLAMSPGGPLRETRSNLATLSFLYADFLSVSPRAVTLLLTNRAAAPASLAPRRENSLRKRTI